MKEAMVTVKQGILRGAHLISVEGQEYVSFKGVPYAEPPLGKLRFQDPRPPKPWNGVRDALRGGDACAQFDADYAKKFVGSDDCLYLSVATPSLSGRRPVMVAIHGGAFMFGSGNEGLFSGDYMIRQDIVYVLPTYRLGSLGFLNMNHEMAPGNMGLKDLVMVLKWIQENIEAFGGDPDNVTVFGISSAGSTCLFLAISPLAKGLIHKAICMSGGISRLGGVFDHEFCSKIGFGLTAALGKETTDPEEAVSFLQTVPLADLIEAQRDLLPSEYRIVYGESMTFGPSVDDARRNSFFPKSVIELVKEGTHVPLMIGYCRDEGIMFLAGLTKDSYEEIDKNFDEKAKSSLGIDNSAAKIKELRQLYFKGLPITHARRGSYADFLGDIMFTASTHWLVETLARKNNPVYFYKFSYVADWPTVAKRFGIDMEGAGHADDAGALFYRPKNTGNVGLKPGTKDRRTMERITRMWCNFAKTGDPTPKTDDLIPVKWLPVTENEKRYLEISDDLQVGINPDQERWLFWKSVYEKAFE